MNPSVTVDLEGPSNQRTDQLLSDFRVSELFNLLKEDDEEASKLKQAEMERVEKAKQRADQVKAKQKAELLTRQLIKHASNIRDGNPMATGSLRKVPAKAKNACNASLQVRSPPPLSLPQRKSVTKL